MHHETVDIDQRIALRANIVDAHGTERNPEMKAVTVRRRVLSQQGRGETGDRDFRRLCCVGPFGAGDPAVVVFILRRQPLAELQRQFRSRTSVCGRAGLGRALRCRGRLAKSEIRQAQVQPEISIGIPACVRSLHRNHIDASAFNGDDRVGLGEVA